MNSNIHKSFQNLCEVVSYLLTYLLTYLHLYINTRFLYKITSIFAPRSNFLLNPLFPSASMLSPRLVESDAIEGIFRILILWSTPVHLSVKVSPGPVGPFLFANIWSCVESKYSFNPCWLLITEIKFNIIKKNSDIRLPPTLGIRRWFNFCILVTFKYVKSLSQSQIDYQRNAHSYC